MKTKQVSLEHKPYLIQRLNKPIRYEFSSFGLVGLEDGGFSKKGFGILKSIWSYDYMGAAEFEFGAIPKSLQRIVKSIKDYTTKEINVTAKYFDFKTGKELVNSKVIYIIAKKEVMNDVCNYIPKIANREIHLKETAMLNKAICTNNTDVVGWHDINNHYLFFIDKIMFKNFTKLIRLKNHLK